MTLNQVINRIENICLTHKMVRSFYRGFSADFLADKNKNYPAVFLEESGGTINTKGSGASLNYRLSFFDLVNVNEGTKLNEQDVESDMFSVALDVVAQMNYPAWDDWQLSIDNKVEIVTAEQGGDEYGGCTLDFTIRIMFSQNVCAVPSDLIFTPGTDYAGNDLEVNIYNLTYIATGAEGFNLSLPPLAGKTVVLITRNTVALTKVSNNPASGQFSFSGTVLKFGDTLTAGQSFLILYR